MYGVCSTLTTVARIEICTCRKLEIITVGQRDTVILLLADVTTCLLAKTFLDSTHLQNTPEVYPFEHISFVLSTFARDIHTGLLICQRYHVSPHPMCHNSGIPQPVYSFYTDDETRIYIHIPFLRR